MSRLSIILILSLFGAAVVHSASITYDWNIGAKRIAPDGFERSASLVNGQFPGPLLKANKGDSVRVNVHNNLDDPDMLHSTSIHWHGIFQPRNAHNDGPSFVTQCPIATGHSYPYTLALGDQAGTFWYHSHLSPQYVDGIRGPIVIYDPKDPHKDLYDVDDENTIITLADWYHGPAPVLKQDWLDGVTGEPAPDSGVINGIGRYPGVKQLPRARINVTHGKRYRFRIISMSAEGFFLFSIANHSLTVIEADGISTEPYTVDSIPVLTGQRYSVVVTANQVPGNYWINANQTIFSGPINDTFAVLHYDTAPDAEPTSPAPKDLAPDSIPFFEYQLKPLINPGAPGGSKDADQVFNFNFTTNGTAWFFNNTQYQPPSLPTLLNILAHGATNDSDFGHNENTFVLRPNSVIEVGFIGGGGHAFHLHGHAFDVIKSASGGEVNYKNPPRRDVVASGGTGVRIRFRTDNPGPWFVHCHIDWHLDVGLALVFAEDPNGIRKGPKSDQPNAEWEKLCSIYKNLPPGLQ